MIHDLLNIIDPAIRTVHPKLGFNDMRPYIIRNTLLYQYAYKVDCGMKALQTICKRKNEQKIKKIRPVIDYLNENNIQYVLIKGLATIFYGYKSLGLRNSGDVDILVHPSQADALYETLITQFQAKQMAGYIQSYKLLTQHYPPLIINDVCFELHFRLNHYCELVNSSCEFILNNPQIVTYESLTFKIPDIECHFIILCHHLYRDEYLDQNYCLRRHSDVLYFWAACEKYIDIPRLLFLSNIMGYDFALFYALRRINELYIYQNKSPIFDGKVFKILLRDDYIGQIDLIKCRQLLDNRTVSDWQTLINRIDDKEVFLYPNRFIYNNQYGTIKDLICREFFLNAQIERHEKVLSDHNIAFRSDAMV